ncbi:methylenetetrahydrofolate reductase [NAD(P)H] [Thiolapillus brandeum]|uniref:Methylenetetrahydrofolate reductase n=1 Tax=Thiolapillus brandeum TaxID=1076588 RepID=A0A7U6JIF6_9GAMM|nr:methylenetetrahydrofolate reductase [NAD(P)H] [Thiolapillus brandeum]BAO45489.1 5,10-methylenetetrahydrofolate reductase [Thiolapillus brandeum]
MQDSDNNTSISFELFPPKTEKGMDKLKTTVARLDELKPEYFSVTYGAGGSTQERTFATVDWLRKQGIDTAPHLSCVGADREEIAEILEHYRHQGIRRIVALRGDLPSGSGLGGMGELNYANELVSFIRERFGDHFHIEVAAYPEFHPQAENARADLDNFARKVHSGANGAITQYFYNPDAYWRFLDDCNARDIDVPIIPGIMPITNYHSLARFSDACGAEIPRWIRKRLEAWGDDLDTIRDFGEEVVSQLCRNLLDGGAPGLHFYTMNQSGPVVNICNNLGLRASAT